MGLIELGKYLALLELYSALKALSRYAYKYLYKTT